SESTRPAADTSAAGWPFYSDNLKVQRKDNDTWSDADVSLDSITDIDTASYAYWTYSITLPKNKTYRLAAKSTSITAKGQDNQTHYYAVKNNTDTQDLMLTMANPFTATINWKDTSGKGSTRPTADEWKTNHYKLCAVHDDGSSMSDEWIQTYSDNVTITDNGNNTWTINAGNLPLYDDDGLPITWYVDQLSSEENPLSKSPATGTYDTPEYNNQGVHAQNTEHLYNNGTLTNTLINDATFQITKEWNDGHEAVALDDESAAGIWAERPKVELRLYRYLSTDNDMSKATLVPGMDVMVLNDTAGLKATPIEGEGITNTTNSITFDYTVDGKSTLEKYNSDGIKYIYYVQESISGKTTDYKTIYLNGEDSEKNYGLDQCTIQNNKSAIASESASKTWIASSMQGMNASVTMELQSRKANSEDPWVTCTDGNGQPITTTISGFSAEQMSQSQAYGGTFNKYDENGYELEYRSVEVGGTVSTDFVPNKESIPFTLSKDDSNDTIDKTFTINSACPEG
ncbi:MAG: hypothetical protein GX481_09135, partial [Atopobium sp.]|nr:hypothetical protein [Atopobium sp.]